MVNIIWIANILIFTVQNIPADEPLVQVNLNDCTIPKIIYEVLYNRLIYIGPERIFKVVKNVDIPLNRKKALNYHCEYYIISKSIYMIFYTFFSPAVRPFIEIYVDTVQHKPMSFNRHKYTVHILNRYSNYQQIFFIKTEDKVFKKFIEFIIYIENQTPSLKI